MRIINGLPEDINPSHFSEEVKIIMRGLMSEGAHQRRASREKLAAMGPAVLPQIYKMLDSAHPQLRWEAAQTLKVMASVEAIPELLGLLADGDDDVRWIAAEGLIEIGRDALVPLLELVIDHSANPDIRDGAHHILAQVLTKAERHENKKLMYALSNYRRTGESAPHLAAELINRLTKQQTGQ